MGSGIGQWLVLPLPSTPPPHLSNRLILVLFSLVVPPDAHTPVHDHLAWGLVGLYRGTQDEEIYAERDGRLELQERRALAPADFYALLPPRTTSTGCARPPETSVSIHLLTNDTGCV
jgi:3-mercaptopropionate dioxygenase